MHLIETSYDRLKSRETISNTGKILLKAGVFRWVTNIRYEHKRYYHTFRIIHYYLLRAFRILHKSFHAKS